MGSSVVGYRIPDRGCRFCSTRCFEPSTKIRSARGGTQDNRRQAIAPGKSHLTSAAKGTEFRLTRGKLSAWRQAKPDFFPSAECIVL